jgi:hypothetical protein
MRFQLMLALVSIATAASFEKRSTYSGVATFNNYASQSKYVFKITGVLFSYPGKS